MDATEYIALKRAIQEDCRRKLEALELVFSISKEFGPQPRLPGVENQTPSENPEPPAELVAKQESEEAQEDESSATEENNTPGQGEGPEAEEDAPSTNGTAERFVLKEAVKAVANSVPRDKLFTQKHVTMTLQRTHRDRRIYPGSVSATLKRLVEEGEVEMAKPAFGGSNPAYYRAVNKEDNTPD